MPRNYSNTIIFKMHCKSDTTDYIYIGHTTSIIKYKYSIKKQIENGKRCEQYDIIRENGGYDNWIITILEYFTECLTKQDANCRVFKWKTEFSQKTPPISSQPPPISSQILPNSSQTPPISSQTPPTRKVHMCNKCQMTFTRSDNLKRHVSKNTCGSESQQIKLLEKEIENLKLQLLPFTNYTNNTNTNSHNTINNTVINNTNTVIELGKEDLVNFFTPKQQAMILNRKHGSLKYLIELVHFNDKYPQFKNMKITNIHDGIAYKYSEKIKKFVAVEKNNMLEDAITCRMQDLKDFHENTIEKQLIDKNTADKLNSFFEQMDTADKQKQTSKEVCFIIYNNRNKVKD